LDYNDFFKLLGNETPICFKENNVRIKASDIEKYNGEYDLYFIPNSGGTKTKDINKFNCFFVDIDCGRIRKMNTIH